MEKVYLDTLLRASWTIYRVFPK